MGKDNSISGLTNELKKIAKDIKDVIALKGVLDDDTSEENFSLFSQYITDTIISDFEQSLTEVFKYPESIKDLIYRRFSKGGYLFWEKYQRPYSDNDTIPLEDIVIGEYNTEEEIEEIKKIFKTSTIYSEDDGEDYYISYFPILNLTKFNNINELFKGNNIVIGLPKIVYDGDEVNDLSSAFNDCTALHNITLQANGENPSKVSVARIFNNCIVLEDFEFENIIPTNINGIADNNDVTSDAIGKLDLTQITSVGNLGYTYSKSGQGVSFCPSLYMPRCKNALNMLIYSVGGCNNITLGVGCAVNAGTFGWGDYAANVGIVSGVIGSINFSGFIAYTGLCVHNWLYSVATDVRTYGHPSDSNANNTRTLTFNSKALDKYNADYLTLDETSIVYIQDVLTEHNTLEFEEDPDNMLSSLNEAIAASTSLKKPIELYDAVYNTASKKRYYVTALDGETITGVHACGFEIVEEGNVRKARLAEGTIFELMDKRCWEYG